MKTLLQTVSILSMIAAPMAASAQDTSSDNALIQNTINVTVQKREQNLRDVPVAVTAIDAAALDNLGLDEFEDLARFVPGFEVQEQSPNNPGFVIRGLTSDSGEANIEPRIAIFQDGVSISRSRGSIVELFDIERVEIAKGPQPTLFGRGALIGGVNIIQAKPEYEFSAKATAGIGNLNEVYADGYITGTLVEDKLSGRLAGRLRQRDGYVESLNPEEEDFNSQDMAAVRGSLRFEPTETMRFDLIANWQRDEPSGTSFKSGAFEPVPGASTAPWAPAFLNTFGDFLDGAPLGLEREIISLSLLSDIDISETLSLSSITGYRETDSVEVFDPDGFDLDLLIFAEDYQGEQFSQEFRLNYDSGDKLSGFVGVSYFDETGSQEVPLTYDERAVQFFLGGAIVPPNAPVADTLPGINLTVFELSAGTQIVPLKPIHNEIFTNFGDTQTFDIFADASYQLTDKLEVTGGLRWTHDDKTSGLLVEFPEGPSNLTFGGIFIQDTGGLIEASDTFTDLTYRLAASYALTDDVNIYANYARGRRPEVITASAGSPQAGFTTLDAEIVDAFETGFKGLFLDGDLSLNGSVFFYDYANFQDTIVNATTGLIEPINAGDAEAYGAELEAIWSINDVAALTASYGYNHARFDDGEGQFPGNRLRLSPDNKLSISGVFSIDLGGKTLRLVPSYTWQDKIYFTNGDTTGEREDLSQDAYGLVNLNAQLDLGAGFGLEGYITNWLNEDYIIDAGNTGDAFGIPTFIAGKPRFYGVRVSKAF